MPDRKFRVNRVTKASSRCVWDVELGRRSTCEIFVERRCNRVSDSFDSPITFVVVFLFGYDGQRCSGSIRQPVFVVVVVRGLSSIVVRLIGALRAVAVRETSVRRDRRSNTERHWRWRGGVRGPAALFVFLSSGPQWRRRAHAASAHRTRASLCFLLFCCCCLLAAAAAVPAPRSCQRTRTRLPLLSLPGDLHEAHPHDRPDTDRSEFY